MNPIRCIQLNEKIDNVRYIIDIEDYLIPKNESLCVSSYSMLPKGTLLQTTNIKNKYKLVKLGLLTTQNDFDKNILYCMNKKFIIYLIINNLN